jgi:hypothetical protein
MTYLRIVVAISLLFAACDKLRVDHCLTQKPILLQRQ